MKTAATLTVDNYQASFVVSDMPSADSASQTLASWSRHEKSAEEAFELS
jgi:hypothetical protein